MITRRIYLSITILMLTVLFMFTFFNAGKESLSDYSVNINAAAENSSASAGNSYDPVTGGVGMNGHTEDTARRRIAFVGKSLMKGTGAEVWQWAAGNRCSLERCDSVFQFEHSDELPEIVVLDSAAVNWEQDMSILTDLNRKGVMLVFAGLPNVRLFHELEDLRQLFGILDIREDETHADGIYLMNGFLLGGAKEYLAVTEEERLLQDLDLDFPWYSLSAGCRAYIKGIPRQDKNQPENYPPLVWVNQLQNACVCAVSDEYTKEGFFAGILAGLMAEQTNYALYPVVNARTLVFLDYPGLADENSQTLLNNYSYVMSQLQYSLVWPQLVKILNASGMNLTCMVSPQFDYQDENEPSSEELTRFMRLMRENHVEAGLSLSAVSDTQVFERLERDTAFLSEELPDYEFTALYGEGIAHDVLKELLKRTELKAVRTVVYGVEDEPKLTAPIGYLSDGITYQRGTFDGFTYHYSDDLRLRCSMTALGYGSETASFLRLLYPNGIEDGLEKLSEKLASSTSGLWKAHSGFETVTLSVSDSRIRDYLALDYQEERNGNTIDLTLTGVDSAWFILRTHMESIASAENCSWQQMEDDVWLIHVIDSQAKITMKSNSAFTS